MSKVKNGLFAFKGQNPSIMQGQYLGTMQLYLEDFESKGSVEMVGRVPVRYMDHFWYKWDEGDFDHFWTKSAILTVFCHLRPCETRSGVGRPPQFSSFLPLDMIWGRY